MSAPAFKAAGTGSETSLVWPTHVTGDLALVFVETAANAVTTPTGCTVIPGFPIQNDASSNTRLYGYYRFATSASEAALAIPGGAPNHAWGTIILYENVHQTQPFHAISTAYHFNAMTVGFFPSIRTHVDDCKVVNVCSYNTDNAGPMSSAETNADLASLTERYDAGTITGNGGGLIVIDGNKAAAGDVTRTTITLSSSSICCATIALAPIADETIAGTVTIDGVAAANGETVRVLDLTQPAASYLVASGTTGGGTGAFSLLAPYTDHNYQVVYEDGASYGASAVDVAV